MLLYNTNIKKQISLSQTFKPRTSSQLTQTNIQFLKSLGLKVKKYY